MLSSETSQARCSKAPQSQEPIRFTVHFLNIFGTTNLTRRIPSPPLSLLCGGINLAARSVAHCARTSSVGSSIIRERGAERGEPYLRPSPPPPSALATGVRCCVITSAHTEPRQQAPVAPRGP